MNTDILVVEDEPADANLIREMLRDSRDTEIVRDVSSALTTIQALAEEDNAPELVLLDLRLPDGSGFDVLHHLRSEIGMENLSVVVLSNSDADTDRDRARDLGADAFETKPMDVDEFARTIADIERSYLPATG